MKSAVATSYELDDVEKAASELANSITRQLELMANSVGILLCDADVDGAALSAKLYERLGIEVAGMTTLASFDPSGYHEGAIVLTVLTADDATFATAASAPLDDSYQTQIAETYRATISGGARAQTATGASPQDHAALIFAFCPNGVSFSGDKYANVLSEVAGNAPVIGGVCSDDYDYERARVFLKGREFKASIVLISAWGNVRPTFAIRHVTSQFAERIRRVSAAEDNVVHKVGDETFVEYLESFGLRTDVPDPLVAFTSYPMMLTREGGDETPLMRHIGALDLETGAGTLLGDAPVGTLANFCLVNREDIKVSANESMAALLENINGQDGYDYSTVICISCCGRAIILGNESDAEGTIISEQLPEGMSLAGAYCLGELCPTLYVDGQAANRFHNCSITFCAL
jgi:hypothetical protein